MAGDAQDAAHQALSHEDLVARHAALVKRIAYHLVSRMPPNVDVDDLMQAGMIGLLEAARRFVTTKGANFATFAGIRIRGAMLDEVRKFDWTPRSVHRKFRQLSESVQRVENRTGHDARDAEVADEMDVSLDEYHRVLRDAAGCRVFSLEQLENPEGGSDPVPDRSNTGPPEAVADADFRHQLVRAIEALPERERLVMSMYYDHELNMREIGEVLEVSESRVCQIHSQALARVCARMQDWRKAA